MADQRLRPLASATVAAALLLAAAGFAGALQGAGPASGGKEEKPARQVTVYCFHRAIRCASCMKMEAWTEQAIHRSFGKELKDGRLRILSINTDAAENKHFVKDYKLTTPMIVLSDTRKGKETRWKQLRQVWSKLRDEAAFRKYITEEVRAYVGRTGPG